MGNIKEFKKSPGVLVLPAHHEKVLGQSKSSIQIVCFGSFQMESVLKIQVVFSVTNICIYMPVFSQKALHELF